MINLYRYRSDLGVQVERGSREEGLLQGLGGALK